MTDSITYPLGQRFSLTFSACEDRLLLNAERTSDTVLLLLTRRMVLLTLRQLADRLPALSGLDKTPHAYWQDVLQLAHQQNLARQQAAGSKPDAQSATAEPPDTVPAQEAAAPAPPRLYLVTEVATQRDGGRLHLAFRGLPVPEAMSTPCALEPVVAFSLEVAHVHHLLQILIQQATQAQWHLPVDLPWLENLDSASPVQTWTH